MLGIVLECLRRSLGGTCPAPATDGELLERFVREGDDGVFSTLVQRHAAMVLTVASRVLRDVHDAEDVFQATFFVLARKARSIRRRQALAGWLYQVAHRLAVKLRASKARRQARERQVEVMAPAADTAADRHELRALLDEELSFLTEKYRTPLVLHYLEGKSKQETAAHLGWSEGRVSGQLARGRAMLRRRLLRRGIALSVSGLTAALADNGAAAAVSSVLLAQTIHAMPAFAKGAALAPGISVAAAHLAKDMVITMGTSKTKILAAVILSSSLLTAGTLALAQRAFQEEGQTAPAAAESDGRSPAKAASAKSTQILEIAGQEADGPMFSASGLVLDSKGQPVADAIVFMREQGNSQTSLTWRPSPTRNVARVKTDHQGRFAFDKVQPPPPHYLRREAFPLDVIVFARGYAVAWKHLPAAGSDLRFILKPESTIRGRLLDSNGNPATRVRVRATQIMSLTAGPRPNSGTHPLADFGSASFLDLEYSDVPLAADSDTDGRFVIRNLPADVRVDLLAADDRFMPREVYAATTVKQPPELISFVSRIQGRPATMHRESVYSNQLTLTLEAGTRIDGTIVFADTGKPAAGARVTGYISRPEPYVTADARGRFSLSRLPLREYWIDVYPPPDTDYLGDILRVELTPKKRVVDAKVKLRRGAPVIGKVIDAQTGKGIGDADIYYLSDTPEFRKSIPFRNVKSRADGSFRVIAPSGMGRLFLPGAPDGYLGDHVMGSIEQTDKRFVRQIDIKMGQPLKGITFALDPGVVVDGQVLDPQGKPVSVAEVRIHLPTGQSSYRNMYVKSDKDGKFTFSGLNAGATYWIALRNKQRTWLSVLTVTAPEGKKRVDLPVKLLPPASVSGRVLDEENRPIIGATVQAFTPFSPRTFEVTSTALTGTDGTFRLTNVLPGHSIFVSASGEGYSQESSGRFETEAGKDSPVGDLVLQKLDQAVAGVIVDQNGKPVAGVEVFASPQRLSTRPTTGKDGRFRITRLPRGTVEIGGVLPWDRERSAFAQRVEAGTMNIRIVVERPSEP
jgi:RNA polymerase sigma factor (sigma-70 family)